MNDLKFWKNFLFKCFLINYAIVLLVAVIWIFIKWPIARLINYLFAVSPEQSMILVLYFMTFVELIAICFFLAPAIALHITEKNRQKNK